MQHDGNPRFATEMSLRDGCTVLVVRGDIDLESAPEFMAAVESAVNGTSRLALDFRAVGFMDSTGLAVLVAAHKRLGRAREAVVLIDPTPTIRRLLHITGIDALVDVRYPDAPGAQDGRARA